MTSKFLFRLLLLFTASYLATPQARAQLCGYDFENLFVLNVHRPGETKQATDVEVYLVHTSKSMNLVSEGFPIGEEYDIDYKLKKIERIPKFKSHDRVAFPGAGDYYMVLISNRWAKHRHLPIYHAMVVYKGDTTLYRLPCEQSLNICENHTSLSERSSARPMVMENGEPFKPIEIVVGEKPTKPTISYPLTELLLQRHYSFSKEERSPPDTRSTPPPSIDSRTHSRFVLDSVTVLDYHTLLPIQVIRLKKAVNTDILPSWHTLIEIEVEGKNPKGIYDMVISSRNENIGLHEPQVIYNQVYLFDSVAQQYVLSRTLSVYPNTYHDPIDKKWKRVAVENNRKFTAVSTLVLEGSEWKVLKSDTTFRPEPKAIVKPTVTPPSPADRSNCLLLPSGYQFTRPILDCAKCTPEGKLVVDTFQIYNSCDITLGLDQLGANKNSFTVPIYINPNSYARVNYSKAHYADSGNLYQVQLDCPIKTDHDQYPHIYYNFFVAGVGTAVRDPVSNRIIKYAGRSLDAYTQLVVEVDENLFATGYGYQLLQSKAKVGQWIYLAKNGAVLSSKYYSKPMTLVIGNPDSASALAEPEIKLHGKWLVPDYKRAFNGYLLHLVEGVDSCRVIAGNRVASCRVNYVALGNNGGQAYEQIYLVAEGDDFMYVGNSKSPIKYSDHQYVIMWNQVVIRSKYYGGEASAINALKERFPKLVFNTVEDWPGQWKVDLSGKTEVERKKLLADLANLEEIQFLSLLVALHGTTFYSFASPSVSLIFKQEVLPAQMKALAEKYGIKDLNPSTSTFYHGQFSGNVIARASYEAINALSREPGVISAYPDFYVRISLDDRPRIPELPRSPRIDELPRRK